MKKHCRAWTAWFLFLSASLTAAAADPDGILWKFRTGGAIHATPLVLDGTVYIGGLDGLFYAIDSETGQARWQFDAGHAVYTTAASEGDRLCFVSGNDMIGLDLSGNFLWRTILFDGAVIDRHDEYDYFHSSPFISDSIAYAGSEQGLLLGVHMRNGEIVYRVQTPSPRITVETKPLVQGGTVFFGDWLGVFYAYDLATGEKKWHYDTKSDNTYGWVNAVLTDIVLHEGALIFGGRSCNLYSLDCETGAKNWMQHDGGSMWMIGGPALSEGRLYVGSSLQYFVQAFDASTGERAWTKGVDYRVLGTPWPADDCLLLGTAYGSGSDFTSPKGSLYAMDKGTGKVINRLPLSGQMRSSVVMAGGAAYFGCTDGKVYAVDKAAFISRPYPVSGFKSTRHLDLGPIPLKGDEVTAELYVYNTGEGRDSLEFQLSAQQLPMGSLTLDPALSLVEGGDSVLVRLRVRPDLLEAKRYSASLIVQSAYNLEKRTFTKSIKMEGTNASTAETGRNPSRMEFSLLPNYPNPFNPATTLCYSLPAETEARLDILDAAGRTVRILVSGLQGPGMHQVVWDGRNGENEESAAGGYFMRLVLGDGGSGRLLVRKMLLMR